MNDHEIMQKVAKGEITPEQATALLAQNRLSLKVSPKGAVQLDGLRRFPITLYADEWDSVLNMAETIRKFIADNTGRLTQKGK